VTQNHIEDADLEGQVDVSVIVPVFNAMPYLRTLLRSLLDQDLGSVTHEIVAVDDGSTDEGAQLLDDLAARHAELRVIHQPNSGWPGIPRNRGLDEARGRYVFFADADDEMGPEALRRLVHFADEHESDVVVPRVIGLGGRWVRDIYGVTQADADLEVVFKTLGPQKLFRLSFLREHGIRFPEEKVRLEDGMFLARAYLAATRVSLLGGYDYYRIVARDDGQNISGQALDPEGYTWSIGQVSRLIREGDPDPERADRIILDLYRRKCLKFYQPARLLRMSSARRQAFLGAHGRFIEEFIPPALEDTLVEPFRTRSRLVRTQDEAALLALARAELVEPLERATLLSARWSRRGGLSLSIELHGARAGGLATPLELRVTRRGGGPVRRLKVSEPQVVQAEAGRPTVSVVTVKVGRRLLRAGHAGVLDLSMTVPNTKQEAQVAAPLISVLPPSRGRARPYATVQRNLSIELSPA
jgi:glycosyltransferase involved in cell wall biosynthesis